MKEFKLICVKWDLEIIYVIENIVDVMSDYKIKTLNVEDNTWNKIIRKCLSNNTDFLMREKINSVTYAGIQITEIL